MKNWLKLLIYLFIWRHSILLLLFSTFSSQVPYQSLGPYLPQTPPHLSHHKISTISLQTCMQLYAGERDDKLWTNHQWSIVVNCNVNGARHLTASDRYNCWKFLVENSHWHICISIHTQSESAHSFVIYTLLKVKDVSMSQAVTFTAKMVTCQKRCYMEML